MNPAGQLLRRAVAAGPIALLLGPGAASAEDAEGARRAAVERANWPADVVRMADDYLGRHAGSPWAPEITQRRERAIVAAEALRRHDVMLFRQAFVDAAAEDAHAQADARLAAIGDRPAIRRLADQAAALGSPRYVGWLQYAMRLGDDEAAYALARHYRRLDQPVLAQVYESEALALGYEPPPALSHARK